MEVPQQKFEPKGKASDYFDKDALGPTRTAMFNMAYAKDEAIRRNKIYLGIIALLIVSMVVLALTANYKTYVVRVDSSTGKIDAATELKATQYSPQEAELRYFLREFIRNTRTVPLDVVMYRQNWDRSQHFLTSDAGQKYANLIAQEGFMGNLGVHTVQPRITSMQRQPNMPNTYEIRWTESVFKDGRQLDNPRRYVGLFTVGIQPPTDEAELGINPLGLFIVDMSYARETGE